MPIINKSIIKGFADVWSKMGNTRNSEIRDIDDLQRLFDEEVRLIGELHKAAKEEFDLLHQEVVELDKIFRGVAIDPKRSERAIKRIEMFRDDFEKLSDLAKSHSPSKLSDLEQFHTYCKIISEKMDELYGIIQKNEIKWGSGYPRALNGAQDIIEKINEALKHAWNSMDGSIRAKWAIDHKLSSDISEIRKNIAA